jgi:hypothetical protein
MALAQIADNFRRNSFACENLSFLSPKIPIAAVRYQRLLYISAPGRCPAGPTLIPALVWLTESPSILFSVFISEYV